MRAIRILLSRIGDQRTFGNLKECTSTRALRMIVYSKYYIYVKNKLKNKTYTNVTFAMPC